MPNKSIIPIWAVNAMQGITYWMGHRHCLYSDYPLSEGALVAELCNLINAKLSLGSSLHCEVQYSNIELAREVKIGSLENMRADLVIAKKTNRTNSKIITPEFIIEVKRAKASQKEINLDLCRLALAHKYGKKGVRTFLFLISESSMPKKFTTEKGGVSSRGKVMIQSLDKKTLGHYIVRRTLKSSHSFLKKGKAQYACIIEVFSISS